MSTESEKGTRVIALSSFTDAAGEFHGYGHEFTMEDTPERAQLLDKGVIRLDDRIAATPPPVEE